MPDKVEEWLLANPLVGVLLMALLGGFLAHLKAMAASRGIANITLREWMFLLAQCLVALSVRMIGAALGGLIVLFSWRALGWPWEYGFVAAGIVGLFSTEFFEWLMQVGKRYLEARLGVTTVKEVERKD